MPQLPHTEFIVVSVLQLPINAGTHEKQALWNIMGYQQQRSCSCLVTMVTRARAITPYPNTVYCCDKMTATGINLYFYCHTQIRRVMMRGRRSVGALHAVIALPAVRAYEGAALLADPAEIVAVGCIVASRRARCSMTAKMLSISS